MRRALIALAGALACAPAPPVDKQPFPPSAPIAAPRAAAPGACSAATLDPAGCARENPRPERCEEAARALQRTSRDAAWRVLEACVATGRFTLLSRLLDDAWAEDLRARPDASTMIARTIAARGGDVTGDLGELRPRRIPVFPVAAAMAQPDVYRGRLVMLRAAARDLKTGDGKATARLAEFALQGSLSYTPDSAPYDVRKASSAYRNSEGYGSSRSSTASRQVYRKTVSNTPVETGVEVIARMGPVDPFFEPGRQFVVLGRFDGVRDDEDETPDAARKVGVVSVIGYWEPSPSVVE